MTLISFILSHVDGTGESNWEQLVEIFITVDRQTNLLQKINEREKDIFQVDGTKSLGKLTVNQAMDLGSLLLTGEERDKDLPAQIFTLNRLADLIPIMESARIQRSEVKADHAQLLKKIEDEI